MKNIANYNFLNKSNTKEIIYISCNPKTLKRDIDILNNYEIKKISAYSMFPKTKHVEMVCALKQKGL